MMMMIRMASCCVANAFLTGWKVIWTRSSLKITKMSKKRTAMQWVTVFPVKPWTPEKISGMFIVLRPIRCEMKPQKITDKPQNGLITTWQETTSSLYLPQGIFNFAVFKYWSFSFSIAALLSPKNRYERHFTKSEVNQEDRIRHS